MSRLHLHRLNTLLCGAILAWFLAGCGDEPRPPRLVSFTPATLAVPGNETIAISVEYEENDFALDDFQWQADAGAIEGNGAPSITYRAPGQPGDYRITVTTHYGDQATELSLTAVVKVTAPRSPEPPVAAVAPEAEALAPAPSQAPEAEMAARSSQAPEQQSGPAEPTAGAEEAGASVAGAAGPQGTRVPAAKADQSPPAPATATAPRPDQAIDQPGQAPPEEPAASAESAAEAGQEAAPPPAATDTGASAAGAGREFAQPPAAPEASAPAGVAEAPPAEAAPVAAGKEGEAAPAPDAQVAALTGTGAAAAAGSRLDRIRDRRRLTAVVQLDFKPFSFYGEDGRRTGFEIDFLHEFARRWVGDANAVTYLPVPADERIPTLQNGRADLIAAALTKTPQRAEQVDFSLTYFKDGQRLLVPDTSDIAEVCALKGRKVAAIEGSTSLDNIKAKAKECGFELDQLITFRRHDDAIEALLAGKVEVFTSDAVALHVSAKGRPLKVVGAPFSEEAYGFAVAKGDAPLLQLIDRTLREMERDGAYAAIYERWFGDAIRPYLGDEGAPVAQAAVAQAAVAQAPPARPAPGEVEPGAGGPAETYVVQPGDTLSRIARKYYGEKWATSWQRIFEANRDVIGDDPARLRAGMNLQIPK